MRARAALLLAAMGLACTPAPSHTETLQTSDGYLISALLERFAVDVQAGRISGALSGLSPDFAHQGDGAAQVEDWCRYWQTVPGTLLVSVHDVTIDLPPGHALTELAPDGTDATVAYTVTVLSCPDADSDPKDCRKLLVQRAFPGGEQAWFSHLRKSSGAWVATGDGEPYGVRLTSRHKGMEYLLDVRVRDPRKLAKSIRVSGPGVRAGEPLEIGSAGDWVFSQPPVIAATPADLPSPPLTYEIEVETASGTRKTDRRVHAVVDDFALPLAPVGEVAPPFVFRWSAAESALRRFQVKVLASGALLWASPTVLDTSLEYAGPSLRPGAYDFELWSYDAFGNASVNSGSFQALAPGALTPTLARVSPVSGAAAGGTLVTLEGSNFLPGARVLFGSGAATDVTLLDAGRLQCRTPANPVGAVPVLVVNPENRVGMLERGFTYE